MSIIADLQTAVAGAVRAGATRLEMVVPAAPTTPTPWTAYVWPADDWVRRELDSSFCSSRSAAVVVDIVASVADIQHSVAWLADRVEEVWDATAGGVEVGGDVTFPDSTGSPFVIGTTQGSELLVVRTEFTRVEF